MAGFLESSGLLRAVLDALPLPVIVADREFCLLDRNAAAGKFLEAAGDGSLRRLPGDLLHCMVALAAPGGCGTGAACPDCFLRGAIAAAMVKGAPVRRRGVLERRGAAGVERLHLFVTATTIPAADGPLGLLIFEDVSELFALRALVPVCAGCKKIRSDADYWEQIEAYLARNLDMSFTHGMCPECLEQYYPEGSAGR